MKRKQKPAETIPSVPEEKPVVLTPVKQTFRWQWLFWLIPVGFVLFTYFTILKDLPSPKKLETGEIPISSKIYDRNGKLLFDIFVDQNRTYPQRNQMQSN